MKVLILHDQTSNRKKVIIYDEKFGLKILEIKKKRMKGDCEKKKIFIKNMRKLVFFAFEIATSIFTGFAFLHVISKKLLEIRGYEALGGEVIAAVLVTLFTYQIIDWLGDKIWTRK